MLSFIKRKIKARGTQKLFAKEIGMRQATLSDFLKGKADVKLSTFTKIIDHSGLEIAEKRPNVLITVQSVILDGKTYKAGDLYKGGVITLCFGSTGTSYQGIVKTGYGNKLELIIV